MEDRLLRLAEIVQFNSKGDGLHGTAIAGIDCIKFSKPTDSGKRNWLASFALIVQGCKKIVLGNETYLAKQGHYIINPIDLPVVSKIESASSESPFLALRLDFDFAVFREVASQLETNWLNDTSSSSCAVFVNLASDKILDSAIRLSKLLNLLDDAKFLGPLVVRELIYHLMKGPDGKAIYQFLQAGSKMHKITEAAYFLGTNLSEKVDIMSLAKTANMSRSAFFTHFKEVTSMSPLQYQKRLRLLAARRLMTEEGYTAELSAFKVGYKSATQFSREYSRMFGLSPLRDTHNVKNLN